MTEKTQSLEPEILVDPNCTITIVVGNNIPNYPSTVSKKNITDAQNAIGRLTFADIWRLPPWRIEEGTVRLDVQGAIANGGRNWQVQINGINGNSTISATLVQGNLATASTAERQQYVQRMVRRALEDSLSTKKVTDVNGPCK
ncbi:hypothetical protein HF324_09220 [Chitinophaga oryzae]|uniref:Uncharacterized protein n=1 Tax=Chitinophaga oryzae TaxID=2725414 RepID=A0AAE6ZF58_9BACT|nr:hypothetical protein [Chitinophaga oryzae]QJB31541.1 hypothetical protein HF329_09565 [Chitinophaga oryzae]QJB38022.1 hypothetical protein HF324_09220 [Chitinophaga oryzae]